MSKKPSNTPTKEQRKHMAHIHIADMNSRFHKETDDSVATIQRYPHGLLNNPSVSPRFEETVVDIVKLDSVGAVMYENNPKAMLDFASYHSPGGGYDNGAWYSQEEMICSESNLYNILNEMRSSFYEQHKHSHHDGLYTSDSLYIEDVQFERDGKLTPCDVIVSAAPNAKSAQQKGITEADIEEALYERINTVMNIAVRNSVDNLVLGAFGCGVFANSPERVASIFKTWIDDNQGYLSRIIFAIPGGKNLRAFEEIFRIS